MFNNIFGSKGTPNKRGFFKVDNEKLIEIDEKPGNGSINSCVDYFGYPRNHVHTILTFNSNKIECLGFKVFSQKLIFVLAKNSDTRISYFDVQKELNQIDWASEYDSLKIEDILNEGILLENLDLKFLMSVIDLKEDSSNIHKSEQLGLYLQFDNSILKAFTSTGFDDSATKWLNSINPTMVRDITEEAKKYHRNDIDVMEEVNKQAKSILGIPHAANNEFIPRHYTKYGNVNWYNLLTTHYKNDCTIDDFMFMNKGRFRKINEFTIEAGNFIYTFNAHGQLESVIDK